MVRHSSLLLVCALSTASLAQAPAIAWQRCLGSSFDENAYDVVQADDSSYVITGYCSGNGGNVAGHHTPDGIGDAWLCRLTPDGSLMSWAHAYGGSEDDNGMSVVQTADGGFLLAGCTRSTDGDVIGNHGDYDCWLVRTDAAGALQWQHTYGGSGEDRANSVVRTTDGGYVVTGYTWSTNGDVTGQHGAADLWLFKVDDTGTLLWQHAYGGTQYETGNQVIRYKTGYAVIGYTFSTDGDVDDRGGAPCDYWLLTTDEAGALIEARSYGGSDFDVGTSIAVAGNDGLIFTGYSGSTDGDITAHHYFYDAWTARVDDALDIVWEQSFGSDGWEEGFRVVPAQGGGFVLAGYADEDGGDVIGVNNIGYADYWIWRIDDAGTLQWQTPIGGSDDDQGYAMVSCSDGGWLVTGIGRSNNGDVLNNHGLATGDFWCVKLEDQTATAIPEQPSTDAVVRWDAQQRALVVSVPTTHGIGQLTLFDPQGRLVFGATLHAGDQRFALGALTPGQYHAVVAAGMLSTTHRVPVH